jgi:hypothetical protein
MIAYIPCLLALAGLPAMAAATSDGLEQWFAADDDTADVNEGMLEFLERADNRRILQTSNHLTITPASLENGWVSLYQCQSNLDPVSAVEVVYRYHGLRNLQVVSSRQVQQARVENNTVQLREVGEGGEVCIRAEVQVLNPYGDSGYTLQSGPFHRRFLDGFYPVQLDYRVHWPAELLQLAVVLPEKQPGFEVHRDAGSLAIDTLFEGKLLIRLGFATRPVAR